MKITLNKAMQVKRRFTGFVLIIFPFMLVPLVFAANNTVIKKTTSEICHSKNSSYYSRIKKYTPYLSLQECLASGGRLPKSYGGPTTSHLSSSKGSKYDRSKFGRGWADVDGDCQDSRQEVLIAQSTVPVKFKSDNRCRVSAGCWISPFSGKVIHNPSVIDIDHVVPLKWAWDNGANKWTKEKRRMFANDPANLLSVEASFNRQKGAKGPNVWLPPANQCEYVLRFLRIVKKYDLRGAVRLSGVRQTVCKK